MFADGAGLSAKVSAQGSISWVFTYRLGGRESKLERLVLGRYPDMTLKAARDRRDQCRTWLAGGCDPRRQLLEDVTQTLKPVTVKTHSYTGSIITPKQIVVTLILSVLSSPLIFIPT